MSKLTGKLKWFNPEKKYGFIKPDDGGTDVLLHISVVEEAGIGNLEPGMKISYNIAENPNKKNMKMAVDICLTDKL